MSKRSPSENLKSFSIIYIILIVLYIIGALLCNFVPEIANLFKGSAEAKDVLLAINIGTASSCIFCLWYFWLARRVADGKSEGTLYMVLLILGIIGTLVNVFMQKGFSFLTLDAIVDILGLYYLLQVRKEK